MRRRPKAVAIHQCHLWHSKGEGSKASTHAYDKILISDDNEHGEYGKAANCRRVLVRARVCVICAGHTKAAK